MKNLTLKIIKKTNEQKKEKVEQFLKKEKKQLESEGYILN